MLPMVVITWSRIRAWLRCRSARSWPSAEACVESTGVSVSVQDNMPKEIVDIRSTGVDSFLAARTEFNYFRPLGQKFTCIRRRLNTLGSGVRSAILAHKAFSLLRLPSF